MKHDREEREWRDELADYAWPEGAPYVKEDADDSDFDEALARVNEILAEDG